MQSSKAIDGNLVARLLVSAICRDLGDEVSKRWPGYRFSLRKDVLTLS